MACIRLPENRIQLEQKNCGVLVRMADRLWEENVSKLARPRIVCLCGSTRFMGAFHVASLEETLAGNIVLSVGCNTKSDTDLLALGQLTEAKKAALDELHKRKIDLADEILVLNVGGYIGKSTRSEIEYAKKAGKGIRWLEDPAIDSNGKVSNADQ